MMDEINDETLFFALSYTISRAHFALRGNRLDADAAGRIAYAILDYWRLNKWHVFYKPSDAALSQVRAPAPKKLAMTSHLALVEEINRGIDRDAI
jgi:hypothetical protein